MSLCATLLPSLSCSCNAPFETLTALTCCVVRAVALTAVAPLLATTLKCGALLPW